ncbi:MAG: DUF3455 domain-containing protein [Bryobacteraceae bacterium]
MTKTFQRLITANVIAFSFAAAAQAQNGLIQAPPAPANLQVPSGNSIYLKGQAEGTQNYVCAASASGPQWKPMGPQATLFVTFPWINGQGKQQITTHFLSANPAEGGTPRPSWQGSLDTSMVWGNPIANSTDPAYVAPGAVAWLLVQAVGTQAGPMGGKMLSETTYIQRLNTSGGVAPATGCDAASYGKVALAPYTTDYYFYRASRR